MAKATRKACFSQKLGPFASRPPAWRRWRRHRRRAVAERRPASRLARIDRRPRPLGRGALKRAGPGLRRFRRRSRADCRATADETVDDEEPSRLATSAGSADRDRRSGADVSDADGRDSAVDSRAEEIDCGQADRSHPHPVPPQHAGQRLHAARGRDAARKRCATASCGWIARWKCR